MVMIELSGGGRLDGITLEIPGAEAPPVWNVPVFNSTKYVTVSYPSMVALPVEKMVFHRGGMNDRGVWMYREAR